MNDLSKMGLWFISIFCVIAVILFVERRVTPSVIVGDTLIVEEDIPKQITIRPARCIAPRHDLYAKRVRRLRDILGDKTSDARIITSLDQAVDDRAGAQNVFAPGRGFNGRVSSDWNWTAVIELDEVKTIKSMLVLHHTTGEGWSTSAEYVDGKLLYPLVVFEKGEQLTRDYDQSLGTYDPGVYTFKLFGQQERFPFAGGQLFVIFSDGTYVVSVIRPSLDVNAASMTPDFLNTPIGPRNRQPIDPPFCQTTLPFKLRHIWQVQEGPWQSTWIRRGDTHTFDAVTRTAQGDHFKYVVSFVSENNRQVHFYRSDVHGYYVGYLTCDGQRVVNGSGDWFDPTDSWSAVIAEIEKQNREDR